jgi:hypothetical protein
MRQSVVSMLAVSCLLTLVSAVAEAQQPAAPTAAPAADEYADLAKKLSNPISDLVSVPMQFNWQQPAGPLELTQFILNIQPVMPFELNKHWNLIARVIFPFIGQPPFIVNGVASSGFGDITSSFFFSPKSTSGFTWGVGPVFTEPASYELTIGSGHWGMGPTVVALKQHDKLTYGILWNQVWSVAGDSRRPEVNRGFFQPFLAYQKTKTITLTIESESTADWDGVSPNDSHVWTIPINFEVSKLSTFGHFPASYQFGIGGFASHPEDGPTWKIRAAIIILLPKAPPH